MTWGDSTLVKSNSDLVQKEQELQFANFLVNHAVDPGFCLGSNAQFLYVNDAACRMSEYSRQELLSMMLYQIDLNLTPQGWSEQWRILKSQGSLTFKSRYRTKRGKTFSAEIAITYVKNNDDEFSCGFVRNQHEVTELSGEQYANKSPHIQEDFHEEVCEYKKTEAELKASLSLVRSTLESTANGILAVNFEGEILCFNKKFMDMWQLPDSVRLSRKCNRAQAFFENQVKNPEVFRQAVWEMPSQCEDESYDLVELKDGRKFAHYSEPQRLGEKIIGRVWSIWDITESKRTEEALRLNEARFRILAETTDASIFLIQGTRLCYVNPAAELLTGYTIKELLNAFDLNQLIKSKKRRQIHKGDGASLCEYQEMQILTKNNTVRWLACTVAVLEGVFDFGGKPVELITAIDITDYKQAESEVRQALEQAKRLSELRQRFVSMISHQLRTPLNVVSFSADLLKHHLHQWTEEKNRSYLDLILVAAQQINQVLDDILLFAKAEASNLKCEPRELDLEQFCRDIVAQMQLMSGNQKLIDFVSQGDCKNLFVDPKLLQSILTNLLSNAIKYSASGSIAVLELSCRDGNVIFKISDTGIGIPAVDQTQLFEPFYRGSNVDNIPGSGLGLSIVKTLVEIHGGQIGVESEVGVGTMFTVMLPLVK